MRRVTLIAASVAAMLTASLCPGQRLLPKRELGDSDLRIGDWFGNSVAVDGGLTVVGAGGDDGRSTEAVYVYNTETGQSLSKLTPPSPTPQNSFARRSVGVDQGVVVVNGAQDYFGFGSIQGTAYLFDAVAGALIAELAVPNEPDANSFGGSVAIDDGIAIVSGGAGAAYLFEASTGSPLGKLVPDNLPSGYSFGGNVEIDGSTAIVGASRYAGRGVYDRQTYLFDVTTGSQVGVIESGGVLAANDGLLIIGKGGSSIVGEAEVYDLATQSPLLTLMGADASIGDRFAYSVAIDSDYAVVGANQDDEAGLNAGAAYVFSVSTGELVGKLLGQGVPGSQDQFGTSVAVADGVVAVGARFGSGAMGAAYTYAIIPEPTTTALTAMAGWLTMSLARRARRDA